MTGDLLSAASLLMAVVGVLYGLWYPELTAAAAVPVRLHQADRKPEKAQVETALRHRAYPLVALSIVLALVLAPPMIDIARHP